MVIVKINFIVLPAENQRIKFYTSRILNDHTPCILSLWFVERKYDDMIYHLGVILPLMLIFILTIFIHMYDCNSSIVFSVMGIYASPCTIYRHVLSYKSWSKIQRFKKHKAVDHIRDVPSTILKFQKSWKGYSDIYKITFLPFRLFTYYGSSSNLGIRFKYHWYNGNKQKNFLGVFLSNFGWHNFSITVVEICPKELLSRQRKLVPVYFFSSSQCTNKYRK